MKFTSEDLLKAMGLKFGDVVKTVRGTYKVLYNEFNNIIELRDMETTNLYGYMESLIDVEFTIIQPKPKLTEDEKVILRNVPEKYKWIARDKLKDELFVYENKPIRLTVCFEMTAYCERICAFKHLFQCIKWEDEPYSIEELLKEV